MPPVYLTPKSSTASPDAMAVCPFPPRRDDADTSCQVIMGPMNVPKLKLRDDDDEEEDAKLGFFLTAPSNKRRVSDDSNDDESLSFVPIEQARHSISVPIIKIRPRPSRAFAAAAALTRAAHTNVAISPTLADIDEEERVALTSSPSVVARAKSIKGAAAVTPTTTTMSSIKNSYRLAARNSKKLKMGSPVAANAATTRRPSSSRAA
uniref:Uncharacterized protein n=1 Tax=Skeletonema marinoi TaxID=267567 RepID=A0A7S1VX46_9STRA|mmetsp:Transcript_944/g.1529  ORF Transcript_944/g.1529 Transcript_944/m.1529 type:complete len:207 (+) Transcript_944:44-664(+)